MPIATAVAFFNPVCRVPEETEIATSLIYPSETKMLIRLLESVGQRFSGVSQ